MTRGKAKQLRALIEALSIALDDATALTGVELFPAWQVNAGYKLNDRIQYNNILYKCVQAHTSQTDWTPDATPALWVIVSVEEWPEWIQPTGAHDAYAKGVKVAHNGKHWVNSLEANTYEPGIYGWDELV